MNLCLSGFFWFAAALSVRCETSGVLIRPAEKPLR